MSANNKTFIDNGLININKGGVCRWVSRSEFQRIWSKQGFKELKASDAQVDNVDDETEDGLDLEAIAAKFKTNPKGLTIDQLHLYAEYEGVEVPEKGKDKIIEAIQAAIN